MMIRRLFAVTATAALLLAGQASIATASPHHGEGLTNLRAATAKYHSLARATEDGYGLLTDTGGVSCISDPEMGAMGVHYVKGALVGDSRIVATTPEALVYRPDRHGLLHLAAVEYVVLKADWDANHNARPRLFGHRFNVTAEPNRYGLPAFYSLHVWVWKHNPAGMFEMWNHKVHCHCG